MGKLLSEYTESINVLKEEKNGKQNYFIEGVMIQAEKKNRNGRIYRAGFLLREVSRYTRDMVEQKRAIGELGHPDSPTVNMDKASHMVTDLTVKGNDVFGKAKILNTPMGRITKELMDEGVKFGVSTRGLGSIRERNGYTEVQDDYQLNAIDIVHDPSAPDAFVNGIYEGKEWVLRNGHWIEEDFEIASARIKRAQIRKNEVIVEEWQRFINGLSHTE